jgi:hypothetical protein
VRLGLASLEGQAEMPGATGYLVEEMVTGAVAEVLLGLRRDPVYGVTLTLGMGGVTAEVLADTVTLVLPVTEAAGAGGCEAACGSGRCSTATAGAQGRHGGGGGDGGAAWGADAGRRQP